MAINFRDRANVKYFMQTQVLQFYEESATVSSSLVKNNYY